MEDTKTYEIFNVKDLYFKDFITVDMVACDKEREKLSMVFDDFGPCSCPCPSPCACPVQRK